jgi:hypothetical protein
MPRIVQKKAALLGAIVLLGCIEAYAVSPTVRSYSVTDIGVLPGFTQTMGNSINALGEVAGSCSTYGASGLTSQHAFVYRGGKLIDFGAHYNPAQNTSAKFVNVEGEVILTYSVFPYTYSVLYRNGRFTNLPFPTYTDGGGITGLNDRGQIAGNFVANNGNNSALLIQPNGEIITLPPYGPLGSQGIINVSGLTEGGLVYGSVYTGTSQDFGSPVDAVITSAHEPVKLLGSFEYGTGNLLVNNRGDFVVIAAELEPTVSPILHVGTKTINLGYLSDAQSDPYYNVTGINDFDIVVGYALSQGSNILLPFVSFNGTMYDANTLISPPRPSVHILQILGVNNAGQLLATGSINHTLGYDAPTNTFILNPRSR